MIFGQKVLEKYFLKILNEYVGFMEIFDEEVLEKC